MDLEGIEFLTAAVAAGSFAAAARRLGVTPSAVSRRVAQLERDLGVPLLARTTRSLRLTNDGQAFHERCVRILEELREARDTIARATKKPAGLLRVDAPVALGRAVLAPKLKRFLDRYPEIRLDLTLRDHFVDPVAEGLDVLVRIGSLGESNLIARKLGASRILHVATPSYLKRNGTPKNLKDLARHDCLGYLRDGRPAAFKFVAGDSTLATEIEGSFNANDAEVLKQLVIGGQGIAALFDFLVRDELASGQLVEVLDQHPGTMWPIHALYPRNRHLLPKVGVFLDFLTTLCGRRA
ncbi:Transcriptional regulator, LysR family [Labilithrix luteola]|uniref:Transcriptional regulator, LysR family n=1 Tax=Labilithrix luteola TaxID=1391654 RepID=A0A0K1QFS9_9BACT|nr:LysR family transcriptional regulator [Labilithrix luteola]AKV04270.1 Transcriptional regulator, LysR family [Labilithrix luteola]